MDYIKRHLEEKVISLSRTFSAILLTGPRQSGKTTMLKRLAEKEGSGREYVTLVGKGYGEKRSGAVSSAP